MRLLTLIFWGVAGWVTLNLLASIADAVTGWATDPAQGALGLLAVLALLTAVVVVPILARRLRVSRPWLWWPVFGAPVVVCWLAITWRATCEGLGLSVPARRFSRYAVVPTGSGRRGRGSGGVVVKGEPLKLVTPRRVGLRFSRAGLAVTVRLHPSQVPGDYERRAEAFAHAWRVHRVRVTSPRPGFVTLAALGFDPLRHPPSNPPSGSTSPVTTTTATVEAAGSEGRSHVPVPGVLVVAVGVREDGRSWVVDLRQRAHHLVTGATQSGKSTLTVRLLAELAGRPVALVGIDAKGGMELSPFAPRLSALATTRAEAAAALEALCVVMTLRMTTCRTAGARSIWELPAGERPEPIVVVVDEIAELFLAVDRTSKDEATRCVTALVRLGQLGAAVGVHLWVAGQRFGSDLGQGATLLRAQLAGRICHRVADQQTAGMTLDGLPPEAVTEAQRIGTDLPGVAVVGDDSGDWYLARSQPLGIARAARLATTHAGLAVPLPEVLAAIDAVRTGEPGNGGISGSTGGDW